MNAVYIANLRKLGVEVDANIEKYLSKLVATQCGDRVRNWLCEYRRDQLMDDRILMGRISELDLNLGR